MTLDTVVCGLIDALRWPYCLRIVIRFCRIASSQVSAVVWTTAIRVCVNAVQMK